MDDPDKATIEARRLEMQRAIGERINEALDRAGFDSLAAMIRKLKIVDRNQVYIWARGESLPRVDGLAEIARACNVSLDFLVFGDEETAALADWLVSPAGLGAPEEAKTFLRSLPLRGYRPTVAFYDLALQAWKYGLTADLPPDRAAQMLIDTHANR